MNKYNPNNFYKIFFFSEPKILLFLMNHYTIKTDIIRYYLLSNSTVLKLCSD